jgi:hypothetical protein
MKELLKYRETDYFNLEDYYLLYNDGLLRYNLTRLQLHNGGWYSLLGLEYKMTSVPCINHNELVGMTVKYKGTPVTGTLARNVIDENFGVMWESGENIRKYGLPYYWNEIKNLEL